MMLRCYTFKKPSIKCKYMQVIQFIVDHDRCSRLDCINHVWKNPKNVELRGYQSLLFANLIWADFIAYDKKFKYHVTAKGIKLLKEAYVNDMAKWVKQYH